MKRLDIPDKECFLWEISLKVHQQINIGELSGKTAFKGSFLLNMNSVKGVLWFLVGEVGKKLIRSSCEKA